MLEPFQLELPIDMPAKPPARDYAHFVSVHSAVKTWQVSHSWLTTTRFGQRRMFASKSFASEAKAKDYADKLRAGLTNTTK